MCLLLGEKRVETAGLKDLPFLFPCRSLPTDLLIVNTRTVQVSLLNMLKRRERMMHEAQLVGNFVMPD